MLLIMLVFLLYNYQYVSSVLFPGRSPFSTHQLHSPSQERALRAAFETPTKEGGRGGRASLPGGTTLPFQPSPPPKQQQEQQQQQTPSLVS